MPSGLELVIMKEARAYIANRMQYYVTQLITELVNETPVKTGHAAYSWKFALHPTFVDDAIYSYHVSPNFVVQNSRGEISAWDGIKPGYIINTAQVTKNPAPSDPNWYMRPGGRGERVDLPVGTEYITTVNDYAGRRTRFIEAAILNCEGIRL